VKKFKEREKSGLTVEVRNNDINGALRVLKKRMQTEGIFNEVRERTHFRTKGEKKRLAKAAGRRRWLKKVEKLTTEGKLI
jgi:small subunit ribosomal protein S21